MLNEVFVWSSWLNTSSSTVVEFSSVRARTTVCRSRAFGRCFLFSDSFSAKCSAPFQFPLKIPSDERSTFFYCLAEEWSKWTFGRCPTITSIAGAEALKSVPFPVMRSEGVTPVKFSKKKHRCKYVQSGEFCG